MSKALNDVCDMLDTYSGRDKIIRTLCYTTKLASCYYVNEPDITKKLGKFSSLMSQTRATLRLFDDLPMLRYTLEFGFGEKEPDRTMSALGLLANIVDHLYYPIDKICWLAEHNLITMKEQTKWDVLNTICWVASIYLNLIKTFRCITIMEQHKNCIDKIENESSAALNRLLIKQRMEMISVIRLTLDLLQAGNSLPKGYLWGGKMQTWHIGLLGTISSFIGLYQYFAKKNIK